MKIESGLLGVEESIKALENFLNEEERAVKDALEYILRQMCKYVKDNGPWRDHTSNLRNSISVNMELMKEWESSPTKIQALEALKEQNETPVVRVEGDDYTGCISVGMEYAIWIETKSGYWVLSGAIDKFEPLMEKYFSDRMSVDKLDLEEAATIGYLNYQTNKQFGR
jgi:hypothetical protein